MIASLFTRLARTVFGAGPDLTRYDDALAQAEAEIEEWSPGELAAVVPLLEDIRNLLAQTRDPALVVRNDFVPNMSDIGAVNDAYFRTLEDTTFAAQRFRAETQQADAAAAILKVLHEHHATGYRADIIRCASRGCCGLVLGLDQWANHVLDEILKVFPSPAGNGSALKTPTAPTHPTTKK